LIEIAPVLDDLAIGDSQEVNLGPVEPLSVLNTSLARRRATATFASWACARFTMRTSLRGDADTNRRCRRS